jgi:hypothetical protein
VFSSIRSNEYAINPPSSTNSGSGYIAGIPAVPINDIMATWRQALEAAMTDEEVARL